MNPIPLILAALVLSACGGGDSTLNVFADPESPVVSPVETKPGHAEADAPVVQPVPAVPDAVIPASPASPCHAPQASEQGVEHGKPPVGRCE